MDRIDESALVARISRRLVPLLVLLYLVSFLDRVNIGFAALTMNADLGFTPTIYGWGAGIFFFGYVLFEVPSNLLLERVGARLWIARIMVSWGLISMAMAAVHGLWDFYALRFLLGIAEAGFFPGMLLYLTYWVPALARARLVAGFMVGVPIASAIGSPISGLLLGLDGWYGLKGWQWLFLLEGLPALILGVVVLLRLPDRPAQAAWLSPAEKAWLEQRLAGERRLRERRAHYGLWQALAHPRVLALALLYFGLVVGLYGIGLWLPQIIKGFGLSNVEVGLVAALPYALAAAAMAPWARHSDRTGERTWHVAGPALLGSAGFAASALVSDPVLSMAALSVASIGIYAGLPTFWTLPTAFLTGTAAAGGIALINALGNLGGFVGPYLVGWIRDSTGNFTLALLTLAAAMMMSGVVGLLLGHDASLERAPGVGEGAAMPGRD